MHMEKPLEKPSFPKISDKSENLRARTFTDPSPPVHHASCRLYLHRYCATHGREKMHLQLTTSFQMSSFSSLGAHKQQQGVTEAEIERTVNCTPMHSSMMSSCLLRKLVCVRNNESGWELFCCMLCLYRLTYTPESLFFTQLFPTSPSITTTSDYWESWQARSFQS